MNSIFNKKLKKKVLHMIPKRIAEYVRNQLQEDMMYDQISIKEYKDPFNGS